MPGRDLSHPARVTIPSKRSACIIISTESAMTSRLTSDARMPSWPMEMPSDTAMVMNSNGKPPESRTPDLARWARRARGRLHGVTSFHDDATPICGLSQSSSVMPTARSMARAGARVGPSVTSKLRGLQPTTALGRVTLIWRPGRYRSGSSVMSSWYDVPNRTRPVTRRSGHGRRDHLRPRSGRPPGGGDAPTHGFGLLRGALDLTAVAALEAPISSWPPPSGDW